MSSVELFFSDTNESDWFEILPDYQKNTLIELLEIQNPEDAASAWLESTVNNNSPFGVEKQERDKRFFDILKKEIHKLLCGDPEYQVERENLKKEINKDNNKTAIVSFVSAVIGANVGLAATFIAPIVVIIFIMISKVTLKAWCQL